MNTPDVFAEFPDEFKTDPTAKYIRNLSNQSQYTIDNKQIDLSRITHEISRLDSKLRKMNSDVQNIARDMYTLNLKLDTIINKLQ